MERMKFVNIKTAVRYLSCAVLFFGLFTVCSKSNDQKRLRLHQWFNKGRFCNNSESDTLISKRVSVENKAKLSQLETQNTSAVFFIYNFQLREFLFVLYR